MVVPATHDVGWFHIEPLDRVQAVARDASGGVFVLFGPEERVLYVSSEGQAGVVARDLRGFLTTLITYPYWFDLLKFSGGGKLGEMRAAVEPLEKLASRHSPHLKAHRRLLSEKLGLRPDAAAVEALHTAVRDLGQDVRVLASDGWQFEPLFNHFPAARLRAPRP